MREYIYIYIYIYIYNISVFAQGHCMVKHKIEVNLVFDVFEGKKET
jgi:hypothetical protein